jgi:acyl-CoA thioester hydrolase
MLKASDLPYGGILKDHTHYMPLRVYYEDTDASGIVYNANYLKFSERGRTEFFRLFSGLNQSDLIENEKMVFVLAHTELKFKKPAFFDDLLIMETKVMKLNKVSMTFHHLLRRDNEILNTLEAKIGFVDLIHKKPAKIPSKWITELKKLLD